MSKLHLFIERNNLKQVRALLRSDPPAANLPVSVANPNCPLHLAAWHNNAAIAALLIQNGANVNAVGDNGKTPLHYAALHGGLEVAKLLLESGADLNPVDNAGYSALLTAARGREPSCRKVALLLLEAGAKPDLNSLASLGRIEELCALISDPAAFASCVDSEALVEDAVLWLEHEIGKEGGFEDLDKQREIIDRNADIIDCLLKAGVNINAIGSSTYPALFTAAQFGLAALVKFLLERGADVNIRVPMGGRTMNVMSFSAGEEGREVRKILLESGFSQRDSS